MKKHYTKLERFDKIDIAFEQKCKCGEAFHVIIPYLGTVPMSKLCPKCRLIYTYKFYVYKPKNGNGFRCKLKTRIRFPSQQIRETELEPVKKKDVST